MSAHGTGVTFLTAVEFSAFALADDVGAAATVVGVQFDLGAVSARVLLTVQAGVDLLLDELAAAFAFCDEKWAVIWVRICVHIFWDLI